MEALGERLKHTFQNKTLLENALTHPSALPPHLGHAFERLEFLGDRVLGLLIAEWLYELFPQESEGELAKRFATLVCKETLVDIAYTLKLENVLRIRQEKSTSQKKRLETLLADGCEALLGALYLDGGLKTTRAFVREQWEPYILSSSRPLQDPKSALQEWAQSRGKKHPHYLVIDRSGPAHSPHFTVEVQVENHPPVHGEGSSKQLAEKSAAQRMLEKLATPKNL